MGGSIAYLRSVWLVVNYGVVWGATHPVEDIIVEGAFFPKGLLSHVHSRP